jgi:hypothetical protein
VVWSVPPPADTFVAATDLVELPDGDVVVATYCAISDDGVELRRIGPSGALRWKAQVPGLGVDHSKYRQYVYLERRDDQLYVVSQGSGGNFMERVALATGAHVSLVR